MNDRNDRIGHFRSELRSGLGDTGPAQAPDESVQARFEKLLLEDSSVDDPEKITEGLREDRSILAWPEGLPSFRPDVPSPLPAQSAMVLNGPAEALPQALEPESLPSPIARMPDSVPSGRVIESINRPSEAAVAPISSFEDAATVHASDDPAPRAGKQLTERDSPFVPQVAIGLNRSVLASTPAEREPPIEFVAAPQAVAPEMSPAPVRRMPDPTTSDRPPEAIDLPSAAVDLSPRVEKNSIAQDSSLVPQVAKNLKPPVLASASASASTPIPTPIPEERAPRIGLDAAPQAIAPEMSPAPMRRLPDPVNSDRPPEAIDLPSVAAIPMSFSGEDILTVKASGDPSGDPQPPAEKSSCPQDSFFLPQAEIGSSRSQSAPPQTERPSSIPTHAPAPAPAPAPAAAAGESDQPVGLDTAKRTWQGLLLSDDGEVAVKPSRDRGPVEPERVIQGEVPSHDSEENVIERDRSVQDEQIPLPLPPFSADAPRMPLSPVVSDPNPLAHLPTLPTGALSDLLLEAVSRLQVGTDAMGVKQVRLEIHAEFLPGVRVVLQEAGGRIQVDFICAVESSRQLLSAVARREVTEMARRCRRDLLMRVHGQEDDQETPLRLVEVLGTA